MSEESFKSKMSRTRGRAVATKNESDAANQMPGDMTIKAERRRAGTRTHRPSWGRGALVFRPWPSLDTAAFNEGRGRVLEPYRYGSGDTESSEWHVTMTDVGVIDGPDQQSFVALLADPALDADEYAHRAENNPFTSLVRALDMAVTGTNSRPEFGPFFKFRAWANGDPTKRVFRTKTKLMMIQGAVYQNGEKLYVGGAGQLPAGYGEGEQTQVIQLFNSAADALLCAANEPAESQLSLSKDMEQAMAHGDLVSPQYGRYVTVWNSDVAENSRIGRNCLPLQAPERGMRFRDESDRSKGYVVRLDKQLTIAGDKVLGAASANGFPASLPPRLTELVRQRAQFWDDLLFFPEPDQLAYWIALCLRDHRQVLEYGWADHRTWLGLEEIKAVLANRVQASVPGFDSVKIVVDSTASALLADSTLGDSNGQAQDGNFQVANEFKGELDLSEYESGPEDTFQEAREESVEQVFGVAPADPLAVPPRASTRPGPGVNQFTPEMLGESEEPSIDSFVPAGVTKAKKPTPKTSGKPKTAAKKTAAKTKPAKKPKAKAKTQTPPKAGKTEQKQPSK